MNIFEFNGYKKYVTSRLESLPGRGRGEFRKIAATLQMHTTRVSQVFSGDEDLSPEQAEMLARYLAFTPLESEYLLNLVLRDRAGTRALKDMYERRLEQIRKESTELSNRLPRDKIFNEEQKAIFYSHWYYSAVRMYTSLPGRHTTDSIAAHFGLSHALVVQVANFLVRNELCNDDGSGCFTMGPTRTHLESTSPMVTRLHTNWRLKACEKYDRLTSEELAFTAMVSIKKSDLKKIRQQLLEAIDEIAKTASHPQPDELAFLNIDWMRL